MTPGEYIPVNRDQLGLDERYHYALLKNVDGFQYAVFSRNEDDAFDSRVIVMMNDQCRSPTDWEDAVANMYEDMRKDELERRGEHIDRQGAEVDRR